MKVFMCRLLSELPDHSVNEARRSSYRWLGARNKLCCIFFSFFFFSGRFFYFPRDFCFVYRLQVGDYLDLWLTPALTARLRCVVCMFHQSRLIFGFVRPSKPLENVYVLLFLWTSTVANTRHLSVVLETNRNSERKWNWCIKIRTWSRS